MATAAQYTDPYLTTYTRVPAVVASVPSTRTQMRIGKHPLETA
jgi:hypothetical protein